VASDQNPIKNPAVFRPQGWYVVRFVRSPYGRVSRIIMMPIAGRLAEERIEISREICILRMWFVFIRGISTIALGQATVNAPAAYLQPPGQSSVEQFPKLQCLS
jgi:hypothetical protein